MQAPTVVKRDRMIIVGMDFFGNPFAGGEGWTMQNQIGRLWGRFEEYWEKGKDQIKHLVSGAGYEIHIKPEFGEDAEQFYVMVGVAVQSIEDQPVELVTRVLPAGLYVRLALRGQEIKSNWSSFIYDEWLPTSDYEPAGRFLIEFYPENRFHGADHPDSELEVYVPVKPK